MRNARFFALLASLVLLGMLGCVKKPVALLYVLGQPRFGSDFATTGKFAIDALPIAIDGSVIELSDASSVQFKISAPAGQSVIVNSVGFERASSNKVSFGLLLDGSARMAASDPQMLRKSAARELIRQLGSMSPDNLVSIADFGVGQDSANYFRLLKPYTKVSDSLELFQSLDSVANSDGSPLYTSITRDLNYTDGAIAAADYSRRLLVLTDGHDSSATYDSLGAVIALSLEKQIPVYVVGLGPEANGAELQRLATATGGIYVHVESAAALESFFQAVNLIMTRGYNAIQAQFSPIPTSGTQIDGQMIIYAGGTSADGDISTRIP